ncbi:MAG: YtxH domain-containing protein [Patescibacteria group bacterium]
MEEKDKKRLWDKVIMSAIIGGAIGSVIGASVAPEKGKTTRKKLRNLFSRGSEKLKNILKRVNDKQEKDSDNRK